MPTDWKSTITKELQSASGLETKNYSHVDFGREQNPDCISVVIEESRKGINPFKALVGLVDGIFRFPAAREHADKLMAELRVKLPPGYVAFVGTTRWLGEYKPNGVELVVGPAESQFDILRHARSDAVNYDLETEDLVSRLQKYDRDAGIDIVQAETDTVDFKLHRLPDNLEAFAEDLYDFCPDLVDQGCGSVSALVEEIRKNHRICLWWD